MKQDLWSVEDKNAAEDKYLEVLCFVFLNLNSSKHSHTSYYESLQA